VQRRRELHGLIGRAIEELYSDRLSEHFEMLAHHFARAEDWPRALDYLLKAAEKATQAFGLRQALDLYGEALAVADRQPQSVPAVTIMAIQGTRADLLFGIGDFVRSREAAEALVDLARRSGDRPAEAGALVRIAVALQWAEDFPPAFERVREAIEIAESVGAQAPLGFGLYTRGYLHAVSGRLEEAEADVGRALAIGRAVGDPNRQALALHFLALRRSWQGEYGSSRGLSDEGIRIAREHRLVIPLLRCLWNEGLAASDMGEYDRSLAVLQEGLALAEKIGDDAYIPRFLNTVGWLRIECGDHRAGVELSQQSYEITGRSSRAGHGTGAERRAFIQKGLNALYGALEYMRNNPDYAIKTIATNNELPMAIAKMEYEKTFLRLSRDGKMTLASVEKAMELAAASGVKDMAPAAEVFMNMPITPTKP